MLLPSLLLLLGFVLLIGGGELLVRGAVKIAAFAGLSPLLVGLVIVGMGTSTPELAASVQAGLAGSPGIALGNIVGSNLANLLLILGTSALLAPLVVERGVLWRDGGVGLGAAAALLAAGYVTGLDRLAGALFLAALAAYIFYAYQQERVTASAGGTDHGALWDKAQAAENVDAALVPSDQPSGSLASAGLILLGGLVLIVGGAKLLVDNAIIIAAGFGVSDVVIGLTVVAIGTSLPELVTSVIAALRKQSEIALGNVLGSNIFNILFIGGVTGVIAPGPIPPMILALDLPLMIGASLLVMVFAFTGGRLSRGEGGLLLAAYAAYLGWTVSAAA